jgi:hypothetical protein
VIARQVERPAVPPPTRDIALILLVGVSLAIGYVVGHRAGARAARTETSATLVRWIEQGARGGAR